jgi:hypothetical protein
VKIRLARWEESDGSAHLTVFDENFSDDDISDWLSYTMVGVEVVNLEVTDDELIEYETD